MAQVKFYSVAADANKTDANGIYFVTGGELYKGSSRFGANKVTTQETPPSEGAIGGDINIYEGVTKVFDGTSWITAAEAFSMPAFSTGDSDGYLKLGEVSAQVSGWGTLVASVSANASSIATNASAIASIASIVDTTNNAVTAASGTFTNLTVTDTATFSATSVAASTLTVGGSDISVLISAGADARISAATLSGNISASNGTGLVNEGQVVTYVSTALSSFDNAMHFTGVVTALPSEGMASGDIVVIGPSESLPEGLAEGQEYIYDGSKWEKIGDQSAVTGGTSSSTVNSVTVEVVTAAATAFPSVTLSGVGTAASMNYSTQIDASGSNLTTESAVAAFVSSAITAAELVWLDASGSAIA